MTAGLLALVCGSLCIRPAAAQVVVSSISARVGHTATLLTNRNILIVGGADASGAPITDDAANGVYQVEQVLDSSWTVSAAHMGVARTSHTATLLPNGEVLVVGGYNGGALTNAEVYNPVLNCWHYYATIAGAVRPRFDHTATLLLNGKVLVCGGRDSLNPAVASLATCDLFTPSASASACGSSPGRFDPTTYPMQQGRSLHTATKLPDEESDKAINGGDGGRVLFTGGYDPTLGAYSRLTTAEIYDNGVFKSAYPLSQARAQHTATLMGNGKVLIVGGFGNYDGVTPINDKPISKEPYVSNTFGYLQSTEIYDPVGDNMVYGQSITPAGSAFIRLKQHSATLIADGSVEVLGGLGNISNSYPDGANAAFSTVLKDGSVVTYDAVSYKVTSPSSVLIPSAESHTLTDYEGTLHNVGGVIAEGSVYFTLNPDSPAPQNPRVEFSDGNKIAFDPGAPDTKAGLRVNLANAQVTCKGEVCGKVLYPSFKPDDQAGTVTLEKPPRWSVKANITSGSVYYANFTSGGFQKGDTHGITSGSLVLNVVVNNLGDEFKGANLSNVKMTLDSGRIIGPPFQNGDSTVDIDLAPVNLSGLSGTVGGSFGNLTVTFTPTVTLGPGNVTGTVKLTTDSDHQPIDWNPMTLQSNVGYDALGSAKITDYFADQLNLELATFKADRSVLIVNQMIFGDLEQYQPNKGPANWLYPVGGHALINPRFGQTLTLTSRGASHLIGGWTCDPILWGTQNPPAVTCPMIPVPNYTSRVWNKFSWAPANNFSAASGSMSARRAYHTATTLPNGKILVAGGTNGPNVLQSAEILDPKTKTFSPTGIMKEVRDLHTATLLPNGRVLVAGGLSTNKLSTGAIRGAEIYYPDTGIWLPTGDMISPRSNHTATTLPDGNVLALGGYANGVVQKTAEVYYSTAAVWRRVPDMPEGRWLHTATLMQDGRVLVVGGQNESSLLTTVQIFNSVNSCWEGSAGSPCPFPYNNTPAPLPGAPTPRVRYHTATLLMDGRVMLVGGNDGNWEIGNVWLYDPAKNSWAAGAPLVDTATNLGKRQSHTATLLANGTVLVAGGARAAANGGQPIDSVEQYDPATNNWVIWGGLSTERAYHTMTMAVDGTLFAIGGSNLSSYLNTAESHGLYSSGLDQYSVDYPPSTRRSHIDGTDAPVIDSRPRALPSVGDLFTTTGTRFHGMTEASGGGSNAADSDHRHPRLVLQAVDGSGGGASQSNSGFIVDLSTRIAVNAANNTWSLTDSSITVQVPGNLADANGGMLMPYGWYHLRAGANDQLSESYMLQVGPHRPRTPVDNLSAYTPSPSLSSVGTTSMTFTWNTPAGLVPGTDFDGYNVYVATTGVFISTQPDKGGVGGCPAPATPCNSFSFPIYTLSSSSIQGIKVMPYNISGDYNGAAVSTAAAYTLPNEPVDVYIATTSANTFFIKWSTANSMGVPYNGKGTLYEVYEARDSLFKFIVDTFSLTEGNFAPDSPLGLSPNTPFYFRVRACNLNGNPYGECSDWGLERPIFPALVGVNRYVSTQTMTSLSGLSGSAYSTDTIKWSWTAASGGVNYNVVNATIPATDPKYLLATVSDNHYSQTGLSQNTRSVIQVQAVPPGWIPGGSQGPLSEAATAYTLANSPIFLELSCPRVGDDLHAITTGSIITAWGTRPGGTGPEGKLNPVTYEIQYASGPWSRTTGEWQPGITYKTVSVFYNDTNPNHISTTTILGEINQAAPVYVRARSLNSLGLTWDKAVNTDFSYTDEWTDLISSYDAVGARPDGADRFTSTLPLAPTVFYTIPPTGPTSTTLWWMDQIAWNPPLTRIGYPQSSFQILQTTCTGFDTSGNLQPVFRTVPSSGPDCGIVPPGLGFPSPATEKSNGLWFPTNTGLVTNLKTWVTYYFTIDVQNLPHWEGPLPTDPPGAGPRANVQQDYPTTAASLPHFYTYIPGVVSGSLSVNVTVSTGGSVSGGTVGLFDPKANPPQTQHVVSFSAPGGAFPSDTVVTISTFSPTTKYPKLQGICSPMIGEVTSNLCGGDNRLAFEITTDPPLQPKLPLYFTVTYNDTEPENTADHIAIDKKQAVLLRFDPASCKCVPLPSFVSASTITATLNHLSIFQVGTWPAATTPEFMRIYPNPYYTSREAWLTIDGLPAASRVRIFTLRGEMVLDSSADGNGIFTWKGANRGGRAVASGVYLVVAEGNGIKAVRKLAVIR
ncbi:MAG: hypothetical protein NTY77_01495 [Elusimicrobia bacterium]|nr:hypothetical protein [Elusimicrobiota bacterium]